MLVYTGSLGGGASKVVSFSGDSYELNFVASTALDLFSAFGGNVWTVAGGNTFVRFHFEYILRSF